MPCYLLCVLDRQYWWSFVTPADDTLPLISDPPIWKGEGEIPYEEVGKEQGLKLEAVTDLPENPDKELIGRWGETIVYKYLQSHLENDPSVVTVIALLCCKNVFQ